MSINPPIPKNPKRTFLLQIEVPLPSNKTHNLFIYSDTNPSKLAYEFSKTHNLPYESHQTVLNAIENAMKTHRKKKVKKKLIKSKSDKNRIHIGIYERSLLYKTKTSQKLSELKYQLDQSDEEINTFSPQINPISSTASRYRVEKNIQYNNTSTITNYKSYLNEKIEKLRQKHMESYDNISTMFKPNVNSNTRTVSTRRTLPVYEELYLDYKKRKEFKANLTTRMNKENECSFRPRVNTEKNEKILKKDNSQPFLRLYNYAQKYRQNYIEKYNDSNYNGIEQCVFTSERSNYIVNSKKEEVFRKIFRLLDGDEDGIISRIYVDTRKVPKDIMKLLNPIITELKSENETLNEREFIIACSHMYNLMNFSDRKTLLNFRFLTHNKTQKRKIEFGYKPIYSSQMKIENPYTSFIQSRVMKSLTTTN